MNWALLGQQNDLNAMCKWQTCLIQVSARASWQCREECREGWMPCVYGCYHDDDCLTCSVLNDETRPSFHFCTTRRHPTQLAPQYIPPNLLLKNILQILSLPHNGSLAIASLLGFLCAPRRCAPHINRHGLCENSCCRVSAGGERP